GAMDDVRRAGRDRAEAVRVEHVSLHEAEVLVLCEVEARERVAVEVVEGDHLVPLDELAGERRADEAGAAGDEDPLALEHPPKPRSPVPGRSEAPSRAAPPRR